MRYPARIALLMALVGAAVFAGGLAPPAQAAFGVTESNFEAGTCVVNSCTYESIRADQSEAFTQAAGHPQWGITKLELNHSGNNVEGAALKRLRVDVPPGLAANPEALEKCSEKQFRENACPPESQVGTTELNAVAAETLLLTGLKGKVYNLDPPPGLPLDFGINVEPVGALTAPVQLFLEGHVNWSGDYHEYFEINNVPRRSRSQTSGCSSESKAQGTDVETELQRSCRRRQLPDPAQRVLEQYDLAPGSRILRRGNLTNGNAHARGHRRLRQGPVQTLRGSQTGPSDIGKDVRRTRWRHDGGQGAAERRRKRNQHGRHPRRARDAARRHDAEPGCGAWPRSVFGRADRDRHDEPDHLSGSLQGRDRHDRNRPPAGIAYGQRLSRQSRLAVRSPVRRTRSTSTPRAASACRSVCRARSTRTRARAGWKPRSRTTRSCRSANFA